MKRPETVGAVHTHAHTHTHGNLTNKKTRGKQMKRTKTQKGITLIALIITIVVLLILAVVAIRAVQNTGIITHAKNASSETTIAQEKEQITLALNNWKIEKSLPGTNQTFAKYMEGKIEGATITDNGDGTVTVSFAKNAYTVAEDGTIEKATGVFLNKTSIKLDIAEGVTTTEELTATLKGITGTIQWESDNETIATISATEGEKITVTINQGTAGEAKIIAKCGAETATCIIKIAETIKIGDKVAYNEGSGKTSTVDSAFVMDDLEWRVLDIEADGTIELISTKPTTSKLTLSGEEGWLKAEENLDTLCNELYANGTGVTARSLKVEDVDKLAGITTDVDKQALDSSYGNLWRYKYDATAGQIQYSKSTDNGATWTDYANTSYTTFKAPGEAAINSSNYQEEVIINGQKHTSYNSYEISNKVTQTTSDDISMASLISQGVNDTNTAASGSDVVQWFSSRSVSCYPGYANFGLRIVGSGRVVNINLWVSDGSSSPQTYAVRPVVSLPSSASLTKVDGVWQVNI